MNEFVPTQRLIKLDIFTRIFTLKQIIFLKTGLNDLHHCNKFSPLLVCKPWMMHNRTVSILAMSASSSYTTGLTTTNNNNTTIASYVMNQSENPHSREDNTFTTIRLIVDLSILLFSLFGNILIILSIWKMAKLRNRFTGVLIVNLAVCDILLVLFGLLPEIMVVYDSEKTPSNLIYCKLVNPLATCQVNAISAILVVISIERYVTIKYNKRPVNGLFQQSIATVFINLYAVATVMPYIKTLNLSDSLKCVETWSLTARKNYTIILFLIQIGVPLPVMITLYLLSWRIIRNRNTRTINVMNNNIPHPLLKRRKSMRYSFLKLTASAPRNENRKCSEASTARQKQTKYYLNMFTRVLVLFTLCMLPNQITWFYIEFEPKPLNLYVETIFYWLTFANAVLNPWIYAGYNPLFKRTYKCFMYNIFASCGFVCFDHKDADDDEKKKPGLVKRILRCMRDTETSSSETLISSSLEKAKLTTQSKDEFIGIGEKMCDTQQTEINTDTQCKSNFLWITPWTTQFGGGRQHQTTDQSEAVETYPYYNAFESSVHTTNKADTYNDVMSPETNIYTTKSSLKENTKNHSDNLSNQGLKFRGVFGPQDIDHDTFDISDNLRSFESTNQIHNDRRLSISMLNNTDLQTEWDREQVFRMQSSILDFEKFDKLPETLC